MDFIDYFGKKRKLVSPWHLDPVSKAEKDIKTFKTHT